MSRSSSELPVVALSLLVITSSYAEDRCTKNSFAEDKNNLNNVIQTIPRCVTPIERILEARFRPALTPGKYEAIHPSWFNATLATVGQHFVSKYWFSTIWAATLGSFTLSGQGEIARTLYAGASHTMQGAVKRFISNLIHGELWLKEDLFGPQSNMLESLTRINSIHLTVLNKQGNVKRTETKRTYVPYERIWRAFEKDLRNSRFGRNNSVSSLMTRETPFEFNQFGMLSAFWSFVAFTIIRPIEFGIPAEQVTNEEMEGFLHLWATIGHMTGLEDEFNICLQPNIKEAKIYFERFLYQFLVPGLLNITYEAKVVSELAAKGLIDALIPGLPGIELFDIFLRRILEDVLQIPSRNLERAMTPIGRMTNVPWTRIFIPGMLNSRVFRHSVDQAYNIVIQLLGVQIFGIDTANGTQVAEHAF